MRLWLKPTPAADFLLLFLEFSSSSLTGESLLLFLVGAGAGVGGRIFSKLNTFDLTGLEGTGDAVEARTAVAGVPEFPAAFLLLRKFR